MVEPRLRANNVFTALMQVFLPNRRIWVNALHSQHLAGHFRFEARIPLRDIHEFSQDGELCALRTENWNWAGCLHEGEWYRFISRAGYDTQLAKFAKIDALAEKGDFPASWGTSRLMRGL